jgi:phosphoribosylaminoimidazole-succinocarboxamide synthase
MSKPEFKKREKSDVTLDSSFKERILKEGKTKVVSTHQDASINYKNQVKIVTKDVLTANDGTKQDEIDLGIDKTLQTCYVFKFLEKNKIPTSFLRQINNYTFIAKNTTILPYECVIRRKAYGSMLKRHPDLKPGERFYIPHIEFFHKNAYIPPVGAHEDSSAIMPTSRLMPEERARKFYLKNGEWTVPVETDPLLLWNFGEWREKGADNNSIEGFKYDLYSAKKPTTPEDKLYTEKSSITVQHYLDIVDLMKTVFNLLESRWLDFDIEMIDLKIEVGYDFDEGKLIVSDVIDNDSWRLWPNGDQSKQLDKQAYRDGASLDQVSLNYKKVTDCTRHFLS